MGGCLFVSLPGPQPSRFALLWSKVLRMAIARSREPIPREAVEPDGLGELPGNLVELSLPLNFAWAAPTRQNPTFAVPRGAVFWPLCMTTTPRP
jgi:hypothetical protein